MKITPSFHSFLFLVAVWCAHPFVSHAADEHGFTSEKIQFDDSILSQEQHEQAHKISDQLRCMCGCIRESTATCSCGNAANERLHVKKKVFDGWSEEKIIQDYQTRFGAKGLMSPPDTWFNRSMIFVPYILIIIALFLLIWIAKKWTRKKPANAITTTPSPNNDKYEKQLEKELEFRD